MRLRSRAPAFGSKAGTKSAAEVAYIEDGRFQRFTGRAGLDPAGFIALLCGALGYLLSLRPVCDLLSFDGTRVVVFVSVFCAALWLIRAFTVHRALWGVLSVPVGLLAVQLLYPHTFLPKLHLLRVALFSNQYVLANFDMTELVLAGAVLLCFFLYIAAFCFDSAWVMLIVAVPLLAADAMLGQTPSLLVLVMLLVFHVVGQLSGLRRALPKQGGALAAVALLLAAVGLSYAANATLTPYMSTLLNVPRQLQDAVLPQRFNATESAINRGGLFSNTNEVLSVTLTERPRHAIYLREFVGATYDEGAWHSLDETPFFEDYAAESGIDVNAARAMFLDAMRVQMAELGWQEGETVITRLNGAPAGLYEPYGGEILETADNVDRYSTYDTTYLAYYAMNRSDWINIVRDGAQNAYDAYVTENYLAVPEDELPLLSQMFDSFSTYPGYVQYISMTQRMLANMATYTLTPGITPFGADPIEHFLFVTRRGFCQHFAAAGALMLREVGIPARYVTGYALSPADFTQQADGSFTATVTGENEHAWTEVYSSGFGWLPFEMTPQGAVISADPPQGFGGTVLPAADDSDNPERVDGEEMTATTATATPEPTATPAPSATPAPTATPAPSAESVFFSFVWVLPAVLILLAAALLTGAVFLRRHLILRRRQRADALGQWMQTLRILRHTGRLDAFDPIDEALPARVAEILCIPYEQVAALRMKALEQAFGRAGKSIPADAAVYNAACMVSRRMLSRLENFIYRYVFVFE